MGQLCPANIIYIFRFPPYKKRKPEKNILRFSRFIFLKFYSSRILNFIKRYLELT